MTTYTLEYADGRVSDIVANNTREAQAAARVALGDDVVFCENWDQHGINDDDEPMSRMLIWADEDTAEADQIGAKAIAQIVRNLPA